MMDWNGVKAWYLQRYRFMFLSSYHQDYWVRRSMSRTYFSATRGFTFARITRPYKIGNLLQFERIRLTHQTTNNFCFARNGDFYLDCLQYRATTGRTRILFLYSCIMTNATTLHFWSYGYVVQQLPAARSFWQLAQHLLG